MFDKICLLVIVVISPFLLSSEVCSQQKQTLSNILVNARQLIAEGKLTDALDLLDEVSAAAAVLEKANLILQEEFHWEQAIRNLEFANQLTNEEQYIAYAKRAYDRWKDYINWYHTLSADERAKLDSTHTRINKATAHLGNSITRMRDLRLLYSEYEDIPDVRYLGPDAIRLWKHWLYACPDMRPVKSDERTAKLRKEKICNEKCKDAWLSYADTLKEWVPEAYLRKSVRERKLREVKQIRQTANECVNR